MSTMATEQEFAAARRWAAESFGLAGGGAPERFPLSFVYGGQESARILQGWRAESAALPSASGTQREAITLTDARTGLECQVDVTTFDEFPAVEWVAHFRNRGAADTPILAAIQALDAAFPAARDRSAQVHHAKGSQCRYDDFEPLEAPLGPGEELRLASIGGRSSDGALPFFDLQAGDGGVIGAIGWTGDWAAAFQRGMEGVRVRAGMQRTHLSLHPGEEIRTPRVLLLFWEEDRVRAHNLWRRLILAHHTPRPKGQMIVPPVADAVWGERTTEDQIAKAHWLKEHDISVEALWIDAGWHGEGAFDPHSDTFGTGWVVQVGNWFPRVAAYPQGLGPVGRALKEMGLGFHLWLEPERVYQGTQFTREHPEWLLGPIGVNSLFNLGIPEARQHLTEMISALIEEAGITCYRQDFNFQPAPYWQAADPPDRVGMSEIRHIEGLYAYWDELLARHPGLIIDNCSSGGRRIDLETISRSVPLWRSDVQCFEGFDPLAMQTQTQGLAPWVPLSTGCAQQATPYAMRSAFGPGMVVGWSARALEMGTDLPLDLVRRLMREELLVRPYFYGDFYPLVSFSLADDAWAAWQFDRPDLGQGMVVAFRRPKSPFPRMETALHGLDPAARYEWRSLDGGATREMAGRELLKEGVAIEIAQKPGAALFVYQRVG
jgi:alpha-galactosidase